VNENAANRRVAVTADGKPNDGHQQSSSIPGTLMVSAGGKRSWRAARCGGGVGGGGGGLEGVPTADRERARVVQLVSYVIIL